MIVQAITAFYEKQNISPRFIVAFIVRLCLKIIQHLFKLFPFTLWKYSAFEDEVKEARFRQSPTKFTVLIEDFNVIYFY